MKRIILSFLFLFFVFGFVSAQSDQSAPRTSKGDDNYRGYELQSKKAEKNLQKRQAKKSRISVYYDQKIEEYHTRMKENAKEYKKMAREMKKPQYSDPSYFGHKNPPKKRDVGKKKFCKVCELVH
jgi:hypothetical protein